jgi:hypothetical protein
MRAAVAVLLLLVLVACGATSEQIRGPDGHLWWSISCRRSQSNCLEEAGDLCPHGYLVADASGGNVGAVAYTSGGFTSVHMKYRGSMLVRCKGRSQPQPEPEE